VTQPPANNPPTDPPIDPVNDNATEETGASAPSPPQQTFGPEGLTGMKPPTEHELASELVQPADRRLPRRVLGASEGRSDGFGSLQPRWLQERTRRNSLPDTVAALRRIDASDTSPRPQGIGDRDPSEWQNPEFFQDEEFCPIEEGENFGQRSPIVRVVLYIALILALIAGFNWLFSFHFEGGFQGKGTAETSTVQPTIAPAGTPSETPDPPYTK